jgi:GT2 family glycosyltransferase
VRRSTTVIVHYGDPEPMIRVANEVVDFDTDVVVVANDCSSRPSSLDPRAEWMIPDRNLGYGEAFNAAIRGRTTDAFVVLNTDIVLSREAFERCLEALLGADDVGIVGPVLRHEDGSLQSGAARFSRWRRAPRVLVDPGPTTVDCEWVTGAVMFVRREVAEQVGMDGSYFLGAEDADLCVRARRAGWRVLCCGDAPATHQGSRVIAGPRWSYYAARNRIWFVRADFGVLPAVLSWLGWAAVLPRIALADIVKRHQMTSSRLTLLALAHALRRKPTAEEGPLPGEPLPARVMEW